MSITPDLGSQTRAWTDATVQRLRNRVFCPACWQAPLVGGACPSCGAEVHRASGAVWDASVTAAQAMIRRQQVLDGLPRRARAERAMPAPAQQHTVPAPQSMQTATPVRPTSQSSASVQSVLAVAGAALFAVAAMVFALVNPELSDGFVRGWILGGVAVLFNVGAWLLARRGLRFSAEAIGALGVVFLTVTTATIAAEFSLAGRFALVFGCGMLAVGAIMLAASYAARLRAWLWTSVLALSSVPATFGMALRDATTVPVFVLIGFLGAAATASALIAATTRLSARFADALRAERGALTAAQLILVGIAVQVVPTAAAPDGVILPPVVFAALALAGLIALGSVGHPIGGFWSVCAGVLLSAAVFALSLTITVPAEAAGLRAGAAAAVALVGVGALLPLRRAVWRGGYRGGGLVLVGCVALAMCATALAVVVERLAPFVGGAVLRLAASLTLPVQLPLDIPAAPATDAAIGSMAVGIAVLGLGAWAYARVRAARTGHQLRAFAGLAIALQLLAVATALCLPLVAAMAPQLALMASAAASLALIRWRRLRRASLSIQLPVRAAAHGFALFAAVTSWADAAQGIAIGAGVLVCVLLAAFTMPSASRFVHVGVGYAYALLLVAAALALMQVEPVAQFCLTATAGSLGAIAASFLPRLRTPLWQAVLVVTAVPFLIGVALVILERNVWTALSTAAMFCLALTLVLRRRDGVGAPVRVAAAALLVPTLSVVIVCVGAVLAASGAPIVLPAVAALVAIVLTCSRALAALIGRHLRDGATGSMCRAAIEGSAMLTGVLAVLLALARVAAGLSTASMVLGILAVGAAGAAVYAGRAYGWWLAWGAATGALWCAWAGVGVAMPEPYLLPPLLAGALVAFVLAARGRQAKPLYASTLLGAVAAMLTLLATTSTPDAAVGVWRAGATLAAAFALTILAATIRRSARATLSALAAATFVAAMLAAAAGPILALRLGLGAQPLASEGVPAVVLCLVLGVVAVIPTALSARGLARVGEQRPNAVLLTSRWVLAPAVATVPVAVWSGIRRDWLVVGVVAAVLVALLVLLVVTAARTRRHRTALPPVWFTFLLAFITAVVTWSPRDLRVECFSIPLGLALLAAGALHLRASATAPPASFDSWPARWHGSWALLTPGILVTVTASVVATFTDPQTWRAVLVMCFALAAIVVGASRRLAAPFVLGIIVLPVENVFVFLVQIGRGIQSMPWWITLALVGAVLLIIAVTYERRSASDGSIAARVRDLA